MANYVKFMRGTKAAYDALVTKNADTLYFITDSENKTSLYLGETAVNNLSPVAEAFLESLPTDENQLNDGDIQVYTIKQEEKEVTDPDTGETTTVIETKGEWVTKSIDETLPLSDIAEDVLPYVLQSIIGDEPKLDEETGLPLYKQDDGSEGTTVTDKPIYANGLSASFDTLKEIAEWLENHSTDALDMQSRISALEQATGVNQTEIQIQPKVDENDNPIYIQETDENGDLLYWDIEEGTNQVILEELDENQPIIPVFIENLEGDEPPYIQAKDENNNLLYWDVNELPNTIKEEDLAEEQPIYPAFIQDTEEVQVPVENNDIDILKTTVGDLSELLGYTNNQNNNEKTLTVIDNLDTRLTALESGSGDIVFNTNVGNLEDLLLRTTPTNEVQENEPTSIVQAINVLDSRTRWQDLN